MSKLCFFLQKLQNYKSYWRKSIWFCNVVIRTNGGTLTIDAASNSVQHYGEGAVLTIEKIANLSFHEYGYFSKASIKQGRIVVENTGKIQVIDASEATAPVSVEKAGSGEVVNVISGENANVTVASDLTDKIAVKATASTKEELVTALAGSATVIDLTANITANTACELSKSVTIVGNGYKYSSSTPFDGALFKLTGENNSIYITNLNLENVNSSSPSSGKSRCIEIDQNATTSNLKVEFTDLKIFAKYGFYSERSALDGEGNSVGGHHNVSLRNCEFNPSCYIAFYWRLSDSNVVAEKCSFGSLNSSNGGGNSTGTVCIGNAKETAGRPQNNTFTLNDCVVDTIQTGSSSQTAITIWSPFNNIVNVNNSVFSGKRISVVAQRWENQEIAKPSHVYFNGELGDSDLNVLVATAFDNLDVKMHGGTTSYYIDNGSHKVADGILDGYEVVQNGDGTYSVRPQA